MEALFIGSAPCEEACAQVGSNDYYERSQKECKEFINLLRRHFGPEPEGARLAIKSNPHDFGTYYEVVAKYDPDNPEGSAYAFKVEAETPTEWDDQSKSALRAAGLLLKGDDEVEEDW